MNVTHQAFCLAIHVGSCKYATCSLDDWSQWEPQELEHGKCGQQQTRKKTYSLTWAYQSHAEQCPSLPQTCPDDIVEKRTQCKGIINILNHSFPLSIKQNALNYRVFSRKKLIGDTIFTASPTKDGTTVLRGHLSLAKSSRWYVRKQYLHFALTFWDPHPGIDRSRPVPAFYRQELPTKLAPRCFFFDRNCSISGEFSLVDIHYCLLNGF